MAKKKKKKKASAANTAQPQPKKRFEVMENESIDDCLARMKAEGYMPVRRMEEPVFTEAESEQDGEPVLLRQQIVFEGKQLLSE